MVLAFIAQAAGGAGAGILGFLPFVLILVVLYFFMLRPQMKRQKEHANMLNALRKGDEVVTGGGLHGKIVDVYEGDQSLKLMVARGVVVTVEKASVARKKAFGAQESSRPSYGKEKPFEEKPKYEEDMYSSVPEVEAGGAMSEREPTSGKNEVWRNQSRSRRSRRRKPSGGTSESA